MKVNLLKKNFLRIEPVRIERKSSAIVFTDKSNLMTGGATVRVVQDPQGEWEGKIVLLKVPHIEVVTHFGETYRTCIRDAVIMECTPEEGEIVKDLT